ncbi:heavy-metal-associated domain-containing protein [Arthrobacter sp. ISL-28]|uniref:heavy-metal-associated domain-containing protein n=1 Tax=Arthrobacter sp. ISL-28 TaxID=2819108 RepID=UPI001BE9F38A|nr:heavy-metal-associated domain-containing protein [Arthrobacter sp. ISL-28]MBT2520071.1 heavy-metal-associated domain-containing protein [Arthrobacter sp. ISL-28]
MCGTESRQELALVSSASGCVPGGRSRLGVSGSAPAAAVRDAVTSTGYSRITS